MTNNFRGYFFLPHTVVAKNSKKIRGRKSGQAMAGPAGPPTTALATDASLITRLRDSNTDGTVVNDIQGGPKK